jgi:hypothetical protein
MDPIVKQVILQIVEVAYIAGTRGIPYSKFIENVHKIIDDAQAEPSLEEVDPDYAIN